jgi:protein-S-isoprenylcysteine O-methyltransferase Ste14
MYVGLIAAIAGPALLLGAPTLLACAALVGLAVHVFVVLYEEPTLRRQFGAAYTRYCGQVRRWWPRMGPFRN